MESALDWVVTALIKSVTLTRCGNYVTSARSNVAHADITDPRIYGFTPLPPPVSAHTPWTRTTESNRRRNAE